MLKRPTIRKIDNTWTITRPVFGFSNVERTTPCRSFKHAVWLSTGAGESKHECVDNSTMGFTDIDISELADMLGITLPLEIEPGDEPEEEDDDDAE